MEKETRVGISQFWWGVPRENPQVRLKSTESQPTYSDCRQGRCDWRPLCQPDSLGLTPNLFKLFPAKQMCQWLTLCLPLVIHFQFNICPIYCCPCQLVYHKGTFDSIWVWQRTVIAFLINFCLLVKKLFGQNKWQQGNHTLFFSLPSTFWHQ